MEMEFLQNSKSLFLFIQCPPLIIQVWRKIPPCSITFNLKQIQIWQKTLVPTKFEVKELDENCCQRILDALPVHPYLKQPLFTNQILSRNFQLITVSLADAIGGVAKRGPGTGFQIPCRHPLNRHLGNCIWTWSMITSFTIPILIFWTPLSRQLHLPF